MLEFHAQEVHREYYVHCWFNGNRCLSSVVLSKGNLVNGLLL